MDRYPYNYSATIGTILAWNPTTRRGLIEERLTGNTLRFEIKAGAPKGLRCGIVVVYESIGRNAFDVQLACTAFHEYGKYLRNTRHLYEY